MHLLPMCAWMLANNSARNKMPISYNHCMIFSCLLIAAILRITEVTKLAEETYAVNRPTSVLQMYQIQNDDICY